MKKSASTPTVSASHLLLTLAAFVAALPLAPSVHAAAFTWDGGGSDGNISTAANWNPDGAPTATGSTLIFDGTTNLSVVNDSITSLAAGSITFASGAGAFTLSGNVITFSTGGNAAIISQQSASNQVISANLNLTSGGVDQQVLFASGAGTLTLSGNINFNNSWLFPTTTAGTIVLSGNNSGDGKGSVLNAGTNTMRAMMRNNVAGTQLVLGSDTALGNSGSGDAAAGTANFKGIVANQQLNISTTGGNRDLSGSTLTINANNITFNGADNLKIGNIITQAGNRDFVVSSTGQVTVANGLFLSNDQTGRNLYLNLSGTGGMVVDGKLYDTFNNSGLTTAGSGILRKAGTGTLTLNGDSSVTFGSVIQIENGTLKLGNANALGATGSTGVTKLQGGNLDLNGQTIGETLQITSTVSQLNNSSASAAAITADTSVSANFTVNNSGDISATRLIGTTIVTVTKQGTGTFTTNGTSHNNLTAWDIQAGTVVFANTSGYGADRGVTINGGTLRLSGANSDLINDSQSFTINSGSFDLNGKSEAVASIGGSGGIIRNGLVSSSSTLYVGGGASGTSSASYAGAITNGNGTLAVTKEGSGTQTFTGALTYTGDTTVNGGTLTLDTASSLLFTLGNSGATNKVLGTGAVNFNGTFKLGLSGVSDSTGTWSLVNVGTLTESFTGSFAVVDNSGALIFTDNSGVWTSSDNRWSFDQSTGVLTLSAAAIPEPSTCALLAGLGILGFAGLRRRRRA